MSEPIASIITPTVTHYTYTPGEAQQKFLRGIEKGKLLGQRCRACGVHFFPPVASCKHCASTDLEQALLGPEAVLHSVTTDHMGTFLKRPHLVGQVQFDEGAFVQGFVDAAIEAEPTIGCRIELVPFEVPAPGGEGTLVTYGFRPRENSDA